MARRTRRLFLIKKAVDLPADDRAGRIRCAGGSSLYGEREPDLQMAARSQVSARARHEIPGGRFALSAGGDRQGNAGGLAGTGP